MQEALTHTTRVRLQALVYPVTDYNFASESYKQYGCGYSLTTKAMQFFWSSYVDGVDADPTSDELLSPLQAKSFDRYGRHQLPIACDTDHLLTHKVRRFAHTPTPTACHQPTS